MPLFDEDELPNGQRVNPIPEVQEFQSARVTTEEQPVGILLTQIGGMRWIPRLVFSQVKGRDEETGSYQGKLRPINRQYRLIHDMEFKVQTPAPNSPSFDAANQEATVKGTARVYPNTFIPNPGDMIIGDTPDGRQAVYQICDSVQPLQIWNKPAYEFEYVMYNWWSADLEREMMQGVVAEYYFVRDNIDAGLNPLIADNNWGIWQELQQLEEQFPQAFVARFLSREYNTLLLPGQPTTVYDPFHTSFCAMMFHQSVSSISGGLNIIPTDDGSNATRLTIHSVMIELNKHLMDNILVKIPVIPAKTFMQEPFLGGIRFAGTNYVVYPVQDRSLLFYPGSPVAVNGLTLQKGITAPTKTRNKLSALFPDDYLGDPFQPSPEPVQNSYSPVLDDDYYIFSEAFYSRDVEDMSKMEVMLWSTIENNVVDPKDLMQLFQESVTWPVIDQFYLQPFLYAMIPAAFRGV